MGDSFEMQSSAEWVRTLRVEVYPPLRQLYLRDRFPMPEAPLRQETAAADAHGGFRIDVETDAALRCSFTIHAAKPAHVTLILTSNAVCKVWQAEQIVSLFKICSPALTLPLHAGDNTFSVDADCRTAGLELSIRVETADGDGLLAAAGENNLERNMPQLAVYLPRRCYADGTDPTWIVTANDCRAFDVHGIYRVRLTDHRTGKRLYACRCRFGSTASVPYAKLRYSPDGFNRADMTVYAKDRYGQVHVSAYTLYRENYTERLPALLAAADVYAADPRQRTERRDAAAALGARIRAPETGTYMRLRFAEILKEVLDNADACTECEIYAPGTKRVFFHDPLDGSLNYYNVTLPPAYHPDRLYPLLILCSTREYGTFGARFADSFEELIVADVSVRGVTLGSYIGEAALLHAFADLQERFSIDPSRVYIGGYSNGASAALAAAQAYPHLFAGVYALSGRAEYDKMENLSEMNTVLLSSPDDTYYDNMRKLYSVQKNRDRACLVLAACHNHLSIQRVWLDRTLLAALLQHRREDYPTHISYRTNRNRHLRAYWITLHGIRQGAAACRLCADAGKSRIDIRVSGATGLSVRIPPYMNRDELLLRINGKVFPCGGFSGETLHFTHGSRGYRRIPAAPLPPDTVRGNGMIDVYMDPLCAVIPTEASAAVRQAAAALTRPLSNGTVSQIAVWYPTFCADRLATMSARFGSMIVIDDGHDPQLAAVRSGCRLLPYRDGFLYNGRRTRAPYCLMQIVQNPWNPEKHILHVSYSDERLLRGNLFTRCMKLPSYFGGVHPYLNGVALWFDGKQYFGILEYGDPLTAIRPAALRKSA